MAKCVTDCRDEIFAKIDLLLPKSIVWKATLLFFMVVGVASGVYVVGLTDRKIAIKENTIATIANSKSIAVIGNDLDYIKAQQKVTNNQLEAVLREIRNKK